MPIADNLGNLDLTASTAQRSLEPPPENSLEIARNFRRAPLPTFKSRLD